MINSRTSRVKIVAVVDPDRRAYEGLVGLAHNERTAIHWMSCGREALRLKADIRPQLWLIGLNLSDVPCFDLLEMLQQLHEHSQFCVVASRYSAEDERRAYLAGRTAYLCKPLETWWLRELVHSRQTARRSA
jgi:DNA-binding response OmpR family regulator